MWNYSDKVYDHFFNPRNVGLVENADGVGEVGSMACGDALRLSFRLDADGRIADAKFQTFGCGSAIASSSILTEMVKGKTLEEAARITNEDIAHELGGLPREKMHCSVMGREALEAAMIDYYKRLGKEVPCELLSQGVLVCHCFQVTRDTIRNAIMRNRLQTIEDVTNYTKAGGGCTDCHPEIQELLTECWQKLQLEEPAEPPASARAAASAAVGAATAASAAVGAAAGAGAPARVAAPDLAARVREVIENDVARALRTDGGDIELVEVRGRDVYVRLIGACASCLASQATIKGWVETQLREHLGAELEVIEVKS
jgi:NifU-like protein